MATSHSESQQVPSSLFKKYFTPLSTHPLLILIFPTKLPLVKNISSCIRRTVPTCTYALLYIYARARNLPSHSLLSCFADISHQLAEYLHASIHPKTGKTAYLSLERFTYAITPFAFKSLKLIGARVTNEIHVSIGIKMIGLPKVESPIMIGAMGRRASLLS